jgi:hypothetical protein
MKKSSNIDLNDLPALGKKGLHALNSYRVFIFFLAVATLYGYIVWRINTFSNAPASTSEETAQTATQPHIDAATVQKIESLKDNSVNVQSLFDAARDNPFNE